MKKAIVFGVTGQDGSYLTELLLKKNYIVHGVKRRSSSFNTERINEKAYLNGKIIISIDKKYFRPTEVESLLGDPRKARKELKWKPHHNIRSLAQDMVTQEINNINDTKKK